MSTTTMGAQEIQSLFDSMRTQTGLGEFEIFKRAYGTSNNGPQEEASKKLGDFLSDVRSCPEIVIRFCQKTLNAKRGSGPPDS